MYSFKNACFFLNKNTSTQYTIGETLIKNSFFLLLDIYFPEKWYQLIKIAFSSIKSTT